MCGAENMLDTDVACATGTLLQLYEINASKASLEASETLNYHVPIALGNGVMDPFGGG